MTNDVWKVPPAETTYRVPVRATQGTVVLCDSPHEGERPVASWLLVRPFDFSSAAMRGINKLACDDCAASFKTWNR